MEGTHKSSALLKSFVAYCEAHHHERFWQALRNWCGWDFVYVSNTWPDDTNNGDGKVVDTYYWENNKTP